MADNELLAFGIGTNSRVLPLNEYRASDILKYGFLSGRVSSEMMNRVLRQATFTSAMCGEFIIDQLGEDVVDNGDVETLLDQFVRAIEVFCKTLFQRPNYSYATVGEMVKDQTLQVGINTQTAGYWFVQDGGATQYEISGTRDTYGIALDNGLFANPRFGNKINFRQFGLKSGDEITDYMGIIPDFPDHEFVWPTISLKCSSLGHRYTLKNRARYRVTSEGPVFIETAFDSRNTNDTQLIRFGTNILGTDYMLMGTHEEYGVRLTQSANIGDREISLESVPDRAQAGDIIHMSVTRTCDGESRSLNNQGQANVIESITGNTVTLKEACLFDYTVGKTITGRVTGDAVTEGTAKSSSYFCYIPVSFDDYTYSTGDRDLLSKITFSNGESAFVDAYYTSKNYLVFNWHEFNSIPKEGDTFTISVNSYVTIRPAVEVIDTAEYVFDLDTGNTSDELNSAGCAGIAYYGIKNIEVSKKNLKKFGYSPLSVQGCYTGSVHHNVADGNNRQNYGTYAFGIDVESCHRVLTHDNEVYGYSQGFNIGGQSLGSTFCDFFDNFYLGGGELYDGTPITPNRIDGKTSKSTAAFCSHGGSNWTRYYNNRIVDAGTPFSPMRGREEEIIENMIFGSCSQIIYTMRNAGITVKRNSYQPLSNNNMTDQGWVPGQDIPTTFFEMDPTFGEYLDLPQLYKTEVVDNTADVIGREMIRIGANRECTLQNFVWGRLTVGRFYNPNNTYSYGGVISSYSGNKIVYMHHCSNLGGHSVLDNRDIFKFESFSFMSTDYFIPQMNDYLWMGDNDLWIYLDDDASITIPLRDARENSVIIDGIQHTGNTGYMSGVVLITDSVTILGGSYDTKHVRASTTDLSGTTGEDGMLTFKYGNSIGSIPSLTIENRLGNSIKYHVSFR